MTISDATDTLYVRVGWFLTAMIDCKSASATGELHSPSVLLQGVNHSFVVVW